MSARSTPSAKTVSRLCRAVSAGSPPFWMALTSKGTVEPSPTPPRAASAAVFTAGSVAGRGGRHRRQGLAITPGAQGQKQPDLAGRRQLRKPSARALIALLSSLADEPEHHLRTGMIAAAPEPPE